MRDNGFTMSVIDTDDMGEIKERYSVPPELQSCHTAIVDGYVVEGHVPAADVERLLENRPAITGIAVPGMLLGSPGMEIEGSAPQPYEVIAFDEVGGTAVYASYPP